jgi:hypothetical protein
MFNKIINSCIWIKKNIFAIIPILLASYLPLVAIEVFLTYQISDLHDLSIRRELTLNEINEKILFPVFVDQHSFLQNLSKELQILPLGVEPNRRGYLCNEGSGGVYIKSDYLGFRNKNEQYAKNIDMLVIGDSFAHGQCVYDNYTITDNLNHYLNTLNLGTSGNHPYIYAALLKNFYPIFRPKFILTIFCDNDKDVIDPNNYFYEFYYKKNFQTYSSNNNKINYLKDTEIFYKKYRDWLIHENKLDNKNLANFQTKKNLLHLTSIFKLSLFRSIAFNFVSKLKYNFLFLPGPTKFFIDELARYQNEFHAVPIITYIPPNKKFTQDRWEKYYENNIKDYAKRNNIRFIDFRSEMKLYSNPDDLYQPKGTHLSNEGYKLLSDTILKNLN